MIQQLLQKASIFIVQEWDTLVVLVRPTIAWLSLKREVGIYEVLEYDSTLELVDPHGETAIFKRKQRVKFLYDDTIAFQDHAWGDGDILAEYKCSPGIVADCYNEGDRWNILISLRETKSRGDIEDIYIERVVRHGFTEDEEWRQMEIWHTIRNLKLSVIFPKERPCKRAVLQQRRTNKTIQLEQRHFSYLPDDRQVLTWEKKNPRRAEVYTIRWKW